MYIPDAFRMTAAGEGPAFMRAHPFATLVSSGPAGLIATHLPTILVEGGDITIIEAHLARPNAHWRDLAELARAKSEVLVIYSGPDAYVTPSWYPSKAETGKAVPTWNYAVVHAYGTPEVIEDRAWLRAHVERLTLQHERSRPEPWAVSDAPEPFIEVMLRGIVGLRISVSRIEGKLKMSQNRSAADRQGVVDGLKARHGRDDLATAALVTQPADRIEKPR